MMWTGSLPRTGLRNDLVNAHYLPMMKLQISKTDATNRSHTMLVIDSRDDKEYSRRLSASNQLKLVLSGR